MQTKKQIANQDSLGIFVGGIAHDFNNLLTSIVVYANLSMNKFSEKDPIYKNLSTINNAALKASELSKQLSLFSHTKPINIKKINLNKLILSITNSNTIKEKLNNKTLNNILENSPLNLKANYGSIKQVIINILYNILNISAATSTINIKTENIIFDNKKVNNKNISFSGKFICISIFLNKNFKHINHNQHDLLDSVNDIGIDIAKKIIEKHKGWIDIYTTKNLAHKYNIFLPAS